MTLKLLALDTSTEHCSVALQANGQLYLRAAVTPREHSQKILGFVDEVLQQAGVTLEQLNGLVSGIGPGSFTGVRIGVSIAQGLAFSRNLPVYPVDTLQALAQQVIRLDASADTMISAIDARMDEVYLGTFKNLKGLAVNVNPAQMAPLNDLSQQSWWAHLVNNAQKLQGAGTGWAAYATQLDPQQQVQVCDGALLPHAQDMLQLALAAIAAGAKPLSAAELQPLYVRNEVAWKKLPGRE
jgi:tRNA threonylcarbamoyladenosine biosynthesis protein TsaB